MIDSANSVQSRFPRAESLITVATVCDRNILNFTDYLGINTLTTVLRSWVLKIYKEGNQNKYNKLETRQYITKGEVWSTYI